MTKTKKRNNLFLFFIALQLKIMISAKVISGICLVVFYHYNIFEISKPALIFFIILSAVGLVIELAITIIIDFYQLKPCEQVISATEKVASGDFSVRVPEKGPKVFCRLASSFNNMAQELGSVEMLRQDFVNTMSHEFKTPIASIGGFAKMLQRNDLSEEEKKEYLDIIISESDRLTELSTNILNLSKLENQTILLDKQKLNITEEIRQVVALLDEKMSKKDIKLDFYGDEVFIFGNKELLKQVWINVLDNAIKYVPVGGKIKIEISPDENNVNVYISNNGSPISKEDIDKIFNKFYQTNEAKKYEGNGLGLAIASRIIALHGGKIFVKESTKKQTTFEVSLPL